MKKEDKIKILAQEIADRKLQIIQIQEEIKTFTMMIERIDEVEITNDAIEFKPKENNE